MYMTSSNKKAYLVWISLVYAMSAHGVAHSSPYVDVNVGFSNETDGAQWGGGFGYDIDDSPWGGEVNFQDVRSSNHIKTFVDDWVSASLTYRHENWLTPGLTIKSGVGLATVFSYTKGPYMANKDYSFNITPNLEISYRVSKYWDVFADYRYFVDDVKHGDDYVSLNNFGLGARLFFARSEPSVNFIDDDALTPAMTILRDNSLSQASQIGSVLDDAGITSATTQFLIDNKISNVQWSELYLSIDDGETINIPVVEHFGVLEQRLPRGKHTLRFKLLGQNLNNGEPRSITSSRSIELYSSQGLHFVLSTNEHLLGEVLDVEVF